MGNIVWDQPKRLALLGAFGALALAPAPAHAATESGSGEAVIVTPLSLVNTAPLSFGNIIPGASAGTVTINQNSGTRTATGGATLAGGMISRASFTGLTGGWGIIIITPPAAPVVLTRAGGGATMTVTSLTLQGSAIRWPGPGQVFNFAVGGTLAVGANQLPGTYAGTFNVTVNYF